MNFKKIISTVAAAAVAISAMAVSTFAIKDYPDGYTLDLIAEGYTVTDVYGFTFHISGDIDSGVGGGVGFNSASTGWESHEWGNADANKELNGSNGVLTILKDAPVFQESDVTDPSNPYAQIWMQQWWGTDITIDSVDVLGAGGTVLAPAAAPAAEEETAEAAEDTAEDVAEDTAEDVAEDTAEDVAEDVAEDDAADVVEDAAEDDTADVVDDAADAAEDVTVDNTSADTAADSTTTPAATGNASAAVILSVMAVAGAAAVVAKKRK